MNVWLLGIGESLPLDGLNYRRWRTGMLAGALVKRGHEVTWWTSTVDHFSKRHVADGNDELEIAPRYSLQFLHGRLYRKNVSLSRLLNHRDLAKQFALLAHGKQRPDILFASFPPIELCRAAVDYARKGDIPSVVDVNDLWPDEITNRLSGPLRMLCAPLIRPLRTATQSLLSRATAIAAISQSYLEWGLRHAGRPQRPSDRVFPLGYPEGELEASTTPDGADSQPSSSPLDSRKIFLFVGTFVGNIDLDCVLDAARMLRQRADVGFRVIGSGERESEWRERAASLPNVEFSGWCSPSTIRRFGRAAYAGLAPYRKGALMSLPNKIYEYLSLGMPVVSSLEGEARELIETSDCGYSYDAGSASALAARITALADDVAIRDRQASNARAIFSARFAEPIVYNELAEHLERMARGKGIGYECAVSDSRYG